MVQTKTRLGEPDYDTGSEEQKSETVYARVRTWSSAQGEVFSSRNRRRALEVDELGDVHELGVSGLAQEGREWFARPLHPQVPTSENARFHHHLLAENQQQRRKSCTTSGTRCSKGRALRAPARRDGSLLPGTEMRGVAAE